MSDATRLPAHLEVTGLIRRVAAAGGFATVIAKGERDGGTILLVSRDSRTNPRLWERMPQLDGTRRWIAGRSQDPENPQEFNDYLTRRATQDRDLWIVELDIPNPERFIGETG
ncbi:MAG: DUF1491 family protein [Novosphingobium sp.]|nr:DUF1491 family protein [Novosphingobium sp.]